MFRARFDGQAPLNPLIFLPEYRISIPRVGGSNLSQRATACPLRPRAGSDETIFRIDEKLSKQLHPYAGADKDKGGVMDFVAAFLALISIGVFAAHTLDALRAD
jgi:hypothetical protein